LERVIEKAGVDYTWKELSKMIVYAPSNDTEIMRVTVTCTDPYEASKIANTIAKVLPVRISEIIDGASMEVVDSAVPDVDKVGPSITKYTAVGILLGGFAAAAVIIIFAMMDDTIHDEDYVLNTYDYPILGKVPDLLNTGNKSYAYYSQKTVNTKD
jgi:capsular polysaccharide biosynthesis protein